MRALARALACAATLLLAACGTIPPQGPVEAPAIYPDQTEPELAFQSFLWAWHTGDVEALEHLLGAWLRHDLRERIAVAEAPDEVAGYYREGAQELTLHEVEWTHRGEALAYVRVVLSAAGVDRAELTFGLVKRPDGWAVTGQKLLR